MLRIIEGKIGSGKTYFAVYHLVKNYYTYDSSIREFIQKPIDFKIITNIAELKLYHLSLQSEIEKVGSLRAFFSYAYQESLGRVVYIIDEAQSLFDRKFYDKDIFLYFQLHRHLGHDIYLITQDAETLPKELRTLAEYSVVPVQRTFRILSEFRYKIMVGYDTIRTVTLRTNQEVFRLYRSQIEKEVEKPKKMLVRYFIYFVVFVVFSFFAFKALMRVFFHQGVQKQDKSKDYDAYMKDLLEKRKKELLEKMRKNGQTSITPESGLSSGVVLADKVSNSEASDVVFVGVYNNDALYQRGNEWVLLHKGKTGALEPLFSSLEPSRLDKVGFPQSDAEAIIVASSRVKQAVCGFDEACWSGDGKASSAPVLQAGAATPLGGVREPASASGDLVINTNKSIKTRGVN